MFRFFRSRYSPRAFRSLFSTTIATITCASAVFSQFTQETIASEIISAKPDFIKMRHAADVSVSIRNFDTNEHLSLIPGGAFVSKSKNVSQLSIIHKNLLFTIEDDSSLVVYQATKSAWQEIGFVDLNTKTKLNVLHISADENILFASTNKEVIKINIAQPSMPKIISRKAVKDENVDSNSASQTLTVDHFRVSLDSKKGIQVWDSNNSLVSQYISNTISRNIIRANDIIAVADGTTGITLLSLNNKGEIRWRGSYNKLDNITHVAYADEHLLAADDKGVLSVFDISNPSTPLLISDFHTHQSISAVQFYKKQAYILVNDNNTTKVMNVDFVSNSSPMISTLGVNQGGSRRSFIENDILYVADWFSGLHLYDIRNPFVPRLLSSFHTPGSPKGVVVKNGIAFVADDDHGLQVIDVSNPRKPTFVSDIPLSGLAYTMKLIDNLLYIASHRGGFHIVDVSDPTAPTLVSTYDTPSKAWALEYKEGLLYVADDSTGLLIFDVKNPAKPKLINQFLPNVDKNKYEDNGFAEDVILKNNKAYIAFFDLGLFIVDISDPLNLKQLAHLPTPGNARGIEIKDDLLYLASWEAGVQIINIASDTNPKIVGHYDTKGAVWGLSVKDKIIYAMDWWGGVKTIDASNTNKPKLIAQYQTAGLINALQYHNRFIYTAHGSRGLQVYDASNDLNPVWATGVDINGDAQAVVISQNSRSLQKNELAIVAAGDGGVAIVNINNPFQSHLIGQLNLSANIKFVQTKNQLVFAAEENGDLFIIDIQQPRSPVLLKRIASNVNQLVINGDKLFILDKHQTLKRYFVNNMTKKHKENEAQSYTLTDFSDNVQFLDDTHFISQTKNQLQTCEINYTLIQCHGKITIPTNIISLHLAAQQLYATTANNDLYVFNIQTDYGVKLNTIYPTSHRIKRISTSKDGIFFGGEAIIASGKLLPTLKITVKNGGFDVQIPDNMPKGAYHLALTHTNGSQSIRKNAVIIGFPKLKSKFTLEQLKAIMKQKNFDGKAPVITP